MQSRRDSSELGDRLCDAYCLVWFAYGGNKRVSDRWTNREHDSPLLRFFGLHQLARKFPDIGRVKVDKFGNIIGGVNPFEGTDVKLEDQPKLDDDAEVGATCLALS